MLNRPPDSAKTNPETVMVGVCLTCKTPVQTLHRLCRLPSGTSGMMWNELASVECVKCKATVYVRPMIVKAVTS